VLRVLLKKSEILIAPARTTPSPRGIIEQAGFPGRLPDRLPGASMDLLGMPDWFSHHDEMVAHARNIVQATSLPVIADADTGIRKRPERPCGRSGNTRTPGSGGVAHRGPGCPQALRHFAGKEVISPEEMVGKIEACAGTRGETPIF